MAGPGENLLAGDDPFAAALEQRSKQKGFLEGDDPFAAEITKRSNATVGNAVRDVGFQLPRGINEGFDLAINAPYNLLRGAAGLVGLELPEAKPIAGHFNPGGAVSKAVADVANPFLPEALQGGEVQEARTDVGRYSRAAGQGIGASLPVTGTILGQANRLAALTPTTAPRAVGQVIGQQAARAPGAVIAGDVAASTGSGVAQQAAEDAGGGPVAQGLAGIAGAVAPAAAVATVQTPLRAYRAARVNASPEGRMLSSMGDTTIDELAGGIAVGSTQNNLALSRRAFDILGEEMVRTGGDRQAALNNTLTRLQALGNSRSAAESQVRNITGAQADSELFLGEYPAVVRSNAETRMRQPSPEAIGAIEAAGVQNVPNTSRAAVRANITRIADEAGVPRRTAADRLVAAREVLEGERLAGAVDDVPLQGQFDAIANAGNTQSASTVTNAVVERLPILRQQFRQRLQEMAPGQRTIEDVENMAANATRQARAEYDAAHNGGNVNYGLLHPLLQRIVERHLYRMAGRSDDVAQELDNAINRLYTSRPAGAALTPDYIPGLEDQLATARQTVRELRRQKAPKPMQDNAARQAEGLAEELRLARREGRPTEQNVLMPSLQMLQDMRGGIRGQITEARQAGRADKVQALQPLYRDITRAMQRSSPEWARANRRWANMELDEVAAELGDAFALKAGPQFRRQLQDFRRMAPEAQDIVRVHFVQKLMDKIDNNPDTHDLAKLFSTPHVKQMVRTVLGDAAAVSLSRSVRDAKVATKSKAALGGSQTAKRTAAQKADDTDLGILAAAEQANLATFRKLLVDWTIGIIKEQRNRGMARRITTPVRDTAAVAEIIQRMRGVQQQQRQQRPLNQLLSPSGVIGAPIAASGEDNY